MNIKYHSVVLFVKNIDLAKEFYKSVLGLEIEMDMGKNVILQCGMTLWEIGTNHIIPKTIGIDKIENKGNGFELYFESEDIRNVVDRLKEKDIQFVHEMHEEPWGQRTIRIWDDDKNIIEIGETLKGFLSRMQNEGLSIKEIVDKTGMKEKDVIRVLEQ
jgi:catechol 2,3-dioxygenase-like lactoylglutathione lyase family enzyme